MSAINEVCPIEWQWQCVSHGTQKWHIPMMRGGETYRKPRPPEPVANIRLPPHAYRRLPEEDIPRIKDQEEEEEEQEEEEEETQEGVRVRETGEAPAQRLEPRAAGCKCFSR